MGHLVLRAVQVIILLGILGFIVQRTHVRDVCIVEGTGGIPGGQIQFIDRLRISAEVLIQQVPFEGAVITELLL